MIWQWLKPSLLVRDIIWCLHSAISVASERLVLRSDRTRNDSKPAGVGSIRSKMNVCYKESAPKVTAPLTFLLWRQSERNKTATGSQHETPLRTPLDRPAETDTSALGQAVESVALAHDVYRLFDYCKRNVDVVYCETGVKKTRIGPLIALHQLLSLWQRFLFSPKKFHN